MTTLYYAEPELLIALNKRAIFVNPNDLQIFKEVQLPEDLTKCGLTVAAEQVTEVDDADKQQSKANAQQETPTIQHALLSPNRQLLAITTSGQKALLLYQLMPVHAKLLSVRALSRTSSALTFASDSTLLLVTDKTGDCYQYDCVKVEAAPKLLLGHLSIVYDLLWTPNKQHIISCDRDDKIRVTNYPDTHDIHGYCLGHKEFVAGMALLEGDVLASLSGDKSLRLWDYVSGKELAQVELPVPGIRLAVRRLEAGKYEAAVLLYQPNESVGIYTLEKMNGGDWHLAEKELQSYDNMIVNNLCFVEDRLLVAGVENERLVLRATPATQVPPNWLDMVHEQFKDDVVRPEDVSAWFKKRYDNVSDYLERKKRRIEEKQK